MQSSFPLIQNHLDFAHDLWKRHLKPGDWAIDATCGNGWDTLELAQLVGPKGGVVSIDIQEAAIAEAKKRACEQQVHFFCQSHETFPELCTRHPIRLIAYNLGYLPGGDKAVTTRVESTLKSVYNGLELLETGGVMSMTCYPGHPEGALEEVALKEFVAALDPKKWNVSHHRWVNRKLAPNLFVIQKSISIKLMLANC